MDDAIWAHRQGETMTGQTEIAKVGAPADAIRVVKRQRPDACGVRVVVIGGILKSVVETRLIKCFRGVQPRIWLEPVRDYRPVRPVKVI